MAHTIKNLPAIWETWIRSLGWEDPMEEGMATHSSILAWRIPMDRGAWWATVHGVAKKRTRLTNPFLSAFILLYKYMFVYIHPFVYLSVCTGLPW